MKILYFARIRQIAGKSSEDVDVPASVATVADLIDHLSARDASVAAALAERRTLRRVSPARSSLKSLGKLR